MSLTSYRAAPPRVERFYLNARCPPRSISGLEDLAATYSPAP
jgi:hypothetical protein